jgi:tryptophanyl-tRNA synthetase
MSKPVILTGIRSNEEPQLGNYFGAILPLVDMARNKSDDYQVNIFVPDLHSFTTEIDYSKLYEQTMSTLKKFVAAGLPLDDPSVHIYRQSYIPAHSELTVILNNFTGFGEMSRMTQFKDKSEGKSNVSLGLFNYPVLMAADILLYNAKYIPVGDDQTQHLEFTRDIAIRINNKFGDIFTAPETVSKQHELFGKDQGLRIKDLQNPLKKMSKSDASGKGVIFLSDDPGVAAKKVMSATTDSIGSVNLDYEKQPGISNLLQIHALLSGEIIEEVSRQHQGQASYGDLKKEVADQIRHFLEEFHNKLSQVDEKLLLRKLEESEELMNQKANETLLKVQKAVGLRRA